MSHLTREERRKKILDNAQNRLQKLKSMKVETNIESPVIHTENKKEKNDNLFHVVDNKEDHDLDDIIPVKSSEKVFGKKDVDSDSKHVLTDSEEQLEDDVGFIPDKEPAVTSEKPVFISDSFFANKYRFILFVLLGWVVFLVTAKGFDNLLSYLIGRQLPKENLPVLVWTSFVAVEVQVVLLQMCVGKRGERKFGMFQIALALLRVPQHIVALFMDFVLVVSGAVSDLCVYIFTIVILTYFDDAEIAL